MGDGLFAETPFRTEALFQVMRLGFAVVGRGVVAGSGFGAREGAAALARRINAAFGAANVLPWKDVEHSVPELLFARVQDRIKTLSVLREKFDVRATAQDPMSPIELVRGS